VQATPSSPNSVACILHITVRPSSVSWALKCIGDHKKRQDSLAVAWHEYPLGNLCINAAKDIVERQATDIIADNAFGVAKEVLAFCVIDPRSQIVGIEVAAGSLDRIREATVKLSASLNTWSAARKEEMFDDVISLIGTMVDTVKHAVVLMITNTVVDMQHSATRAASREWIACLADNDAGHPEELHEQLDAVVEASVAVRAALDPIRNPVLEARCP
jgi:hypothetical protein